MNIERTPEFEDALGKMKSGKAFVFVTGRAGTGKSTLLKYFVEHCHVNAPVLAPTGVAALNVQGETIHRFFKIPPSVDLQTARIEAATRKKPDVYKQIEALVIDEISMVRADLLDCIDVFLQVIRRDKRPFGGVRIIGIGDLYQLPPVVTTADKQTFLQRYKTPYFFSSTSYKNLHAMDQIDFAELTTVYRQKDESFIELLNAIRNRNITNEQLTKVNSRMINDAPPEDAILLTPINETADVINQTRLSKLKTPGHKFDSEVQGKFQEKDMPTDQTLVLKVGARVMCIANDSKGRFVNGSLGWVFGFGGDKENPTVIVKLDDKDEETVIDAYTWNVHRNKFNKKTGELEQEQVGSFKQIPLRLAWAVTIHKSQGKTFDKITLDLGRGAFAAGQVYVALSRCRTFEGLHLLNPITSWQLKPNDDIAHYFDHVLNQPPEIEYVQSHDDGQLSFN
ncbi:MAG: AAA family ATPase [Patescibacteria group bacterium]|jgi:ATP-dependent exoDNAse (exonuclease V) alpha subunit